MELINKYNPYSQERWNILLEIKPFRFYFWTNIFFHRHLGLDYQDNFLQVRLFKKPEETKEIKMDNGYYMVSEETGRHYHIMEN